MARQEHPPRVVPHEPKKRGRSPLLQLLLGLAALALAANNYYRYYPLPPNVLEGFLVLIGLYQLFQVQERMAGAKRKEILKRYI